MRHEPVVAFKTALTLLGRMWNAVPLATGGTTRPALVRPLIGMFYAGMFLAVVLGVLRQPRGNWTAWRPVFVLIIAFSAVHSLYWADMRMRTPLVPAIALLAAAGMASKRLRANEPHTVGQVSNLSAHPA